MKQVTTIKKYDRKETILDIDVINRFRVYINQQIYNTNFTECRYGDDAIQFKTNDGIIASLKHLLDKNPDAIAEINKLVDPIVNEYVKRLFTEVFTVLQNELSQLDDSYLLDKEEL